MDGEPPYSSTLGIGGFTGYRKPSVWKKCLSILCVVLCAVIVSFLPIGQIALSLTQVFDVSVDNYPGSSICSDSIFNEYRPLLIKYYFQEGKPKNASQYKVCSEFKLFKSRSSLQSPSLLKNEDPKNSTVIRCFYPKLDGKDGESKMSIYCGWNLLSTIKRIVVSVLLIFSIIIPAVWVLQNWRILGKFTTPFLGMCYLIVIIIFIILSTWVLVTDSIDIVKSLYFCFTDFQKLCNPPSYPAEPKENCICTYWLYVGTIALDLVLVISWIIMGAVVIMRSTVSCLYDPEKNEYANLDKQVIDTKYDDNEDDDVSVGGTTSGRTNRLKKLLDEFGYD